MRRERHQLAFRKHRYSTFYTTIYSFAMFVPDESLITLLENKCNKNSPVFWVETNASKCSEFPKNCNNTWWNSGESFWSLHQVRDKCMETQWLSASKEIRQTKSTGEVMIIIFCFYYKCIICQHAIPLKTIMNLEYYVQFGKFCDNTYRESVMNR